MSLAPLSPDVLVVGGGAAGIAAAVGAARSGASVVLVERLGFLGGMATAALVGTVCGLYTRSEATVGRMVMGGFPAAFGDALGQASGTGPVVGREGLQFLPYEPLAFRGLADEVLAEAGVTVWLHATVTAVHRQGDRIDAVDVLAWDRVVRIRPASVVDTSGTAVVAELSGVATLSSGEHQAPAYVFGVAGLPDLPVGALHMGLLREMVRGVAEGVLPDDATALSVVPGSYRQGRALLKLGLRGVMGDAPEAMTGLEQRARREVRTIMAAIRARVPGWQDVAVTTLAAQVGVRTGRRPVGRAVLTSDDVLGQRIYPDGIAVGAWPVEVWGSDNRPALTHLPMDGSYQIPAGCVEALGVANLYVAGRQLSATDTAIASARVIGTCLGTGYAAGALAAGAAQGRARDATIGCIRRTQVVSGDGA